MIFVAKVRFISKTGSRHFTGINTLVTDTDAHHTAPLAATAIHNRGDKLCPLTPDIHFRLIPSGEMALCSHDSPGRSDGKP